MQELEPVNRYYPFGERSLFQVFDIMSTTLENAPAALAEMQSIVEGEEPGLVGRIVFGKGRKSEFAVRDVIMSSFLPEVKERLLKIGVEAHLVKEKYAGAIYLLLLADAAKLSMPGYGESFIASQYETSMEKGMFRDALWIASMMRSEGERIVGRTEMIPGRWLEREITTFRAYVNDVLEKTDPEGKIEISWQRMVDLNIILRRFTYRVDGDPDPEVFGNLGRLVATRLIILYLQKGETWAARDVAEKVGIPEDMIRKMESELLPDESSDEPVGWFSEMVDRVLETNLGTRPAAG